MIMKLPHSLVAVVLLAALAFSQEAPPKTDDAKSPAKPRGIIHLQKVKDPPEVHAAQPCNNFSWAASLAAVLAYEHAEIKQDFWIDKYYGGSLCLEQIGDPDDLIRKADGEYVLDDGRHVDVKLQYFAGVPVASSALLVPILTDEIVIIFFDGRADLLVGAKWDEYLSTRGERMIDLQQLHLVDPILPGDKQAIVVDTRSDDIGRMTGYMRVQAVEAHPQYWPK